MPSIPVNQKNRFAMIKGILFFASFVSFLLSVYP